MLVHTSPRLYRENNVYLNYSVHVKVKINKKEFGVGTIYRKRVAKCIISKKITGLCLFNPLAKEFCIK